VAEVAGVKGRVPIAADTLEARLTYALRLSGGTMPQVIIVKDKAEKREALAFLKASPALRCWRLKHRQRTSRGIAGDERPQGR
jgi:hypothetical protein